MNEFDNNILIWNVLQVNEKQGISWPRKTLIRDLFRTWRCYRLIKLSACHESPYYGIFFAMALLS